jgi:putative ABC transport system substrate-binding protein
MVTRRDCLALLLAAPFASSQAQRTVPLVAVLAPHAGYAPSPVFIDELRRLGYEDGRTMKLLLRSADGRLDRLPGLAAELVRARPALIVTFNTPPAQAALAATKEIPIVMGVVGNPVATGLVKNLARPGGNATAVSNYSSELVAKRIGVLHEAVPSARRIAVMLNPDDANTAGQVTEVEAAAPRLGLEISLYRVRNHDELAAELSRLLAWRAEAIFWLIGQNELYMQGTADFGRKHGVPTMLVNPSHVEKGALLMYGPEPADIIRRTAHYVDRVLKGARVGELPVEMPNRYELVVNAATARAIGVTIPRSVLVRADRVIE